MKSHLFYYTQQNNLNSQGFTLLELLVVISLLAVIAGFSLTAYEDVQDQAGHDVVIYEMAEIRNALLQFRRDSGTNDFPGQGIYSCTTSNMTTIAQANDPSGSDTWPKGAPSADSNLSDWQDWCANPANFWMLFINPLDDKTTTLVEENTWNPDTKRGWNGPYLQRKSGFVDVGDNVVSNGTAGNIESGTLISDLWGVASPFIYRPTSSYLIWRTEANNSSTNLSKQGTPYLLFDLDNVDDDNPARIVSLGLDHIYNGEDTSDCLPPAINEDGYPIDHVLCLLR